MIGRVITAGAIITPSLHYLLNGFSTTEEKRIDNVEMEKRC